jgi:importin subunit beta-1
MDGECRFCGNLSAYIHLTVELGCAPFPSSFLAQLFTLHMPCCFSSFFRVDAAIRDPAVAMMQTMESENLVNYLGSLAQELADTSKDTNMRILAATQLKNAVTARTEANQMRLAQRWLTQDHGLRDQVKSLMLQALSSIVGSAAQDKNLRNSTAQAIAVIASIEIPVGMWNDLVPNVISLTQAEGATTGLLESAYTTLGFICEVTPGENLLHHSNAILTAIGAGMMLETQPPEVVYCATHALTDALPFCRSNFENETERGFIMKMVADVMASPVPEIKVAAWQCLGEIAESYYEYLGSYVDSILAATVQTVTELLDSVGAAPIEDPDDARVAMMAIEFWTSIASHEHSVRDMLEEIDEEGDETAEKPVFLNFCAHAYQSKFLPHLLRSLTKQSEDGNDDELTLASAAGACFNEFCFVIGGEFWSEVYQFASVQIVSEDWHYREAACFALGCITEAPYSDELRDSIAGALNAVIERTLDPNLSVRSSAAWCLKQCAERFNTLFADPGALHACLTAVLQTFDDDVKVVKFSAAVIYYLVRTVAMNPDDQAPEELPYGAFTPYFDGLMSKLLSVADNSTQPDMHLACYEAMTQLVEFAATEILDNVFNYLPIFADRLESSIAAVANVVPDDATMAHLENIANLQALSVSMLHTMLVRMDVDRIAPHADRLMAIFLAILNGPTMATASTVGEEALIAITELASQAKSGFQTYMPAFVPVLVRAIEDPTKTDLCIAGVRALSAICGALEGMLNVEDMDKLLGALLASFSSEENVDRTVKLTIVETMVEVKIALGAEFTRYLGHFMTVFVPASQMALPSAHPPGLDSDTLEFLSKLQGKFLMTYMAFLTLVFDGQGAALEGSVQPMVDFALALVKEPERRMGTLTLAIEFISDVCRHAKDINAGIPQMLASLGVHQRIINAGLTSGKKKPKKAAQIADKQYREMCAAANIPVV